MESKAENMFPDGVPAALTVKDFAEALGISHNTAKKYLSADPERTVLVGSAAMVPAWVLYEFLGVSKCERARIREVLK